MKTATQFILLCLLLATRASAQTEQILRLDQVSEHQEYGTGQETVRCKIVTKAATRAEKRSPIGVSAVVDTSGSMTGPRVDILRRTLEYLALEINANSDAIGLVEFNTQAKELFQFQQLNPERYNRLLEAINSIGAEGRTDLTGGILMGLDQIGAAEDTSTKCRTHEVFVFSDGDPNQGVTKKKKMLRLIHNKRGDIVRVTTFPFGALANYQLLQDIADDASGEAYIMEGLNEMPTAFAMAITRLKTTVAQNIRLTFTALPGAKIRVLGDQSRVEMEEGKFRITIPNLSLEDTTHTYMEVDIEPGAPGHQEIVKVELAYEDTTRCREVVEEGLVISIFRADNPNRGENNTAVIETLCADTMGKALLIKERVIDKEQADFVASEMERIANTMRTQDCCHDSTVIPKFIDGADQLRELLLESGTPTEYEVARYREIGDSLIKSRTSLPSIDTDDFHFLHFYDTELSKTKRKEAMEFILPNSPPSPSPVQQPFVPFSSEDTPTYTLPKFGN